MKEKTPSDKALHTGHRSRLRHRYETEGPDAFEDHNLLELLLFYAFPRRDTNEIAHRLIHHFGSLPEVFRATREELQEVEGIGPGSADLLTLVPDVVRAAMLQELSREPLTDPGRIGEYLVWFFRGAPRSTAAILLLDTRGRLLQTELLYSGDREKPLSISDAVLSAAVDQGAASVILAHNHADGRMEASVNDWSLTQQLGETLADHHLSLLDHFIVWKSEWIRWRDGFRSGSYAN